tara:strand:+ start:3667 stop:4335 length:669 start_codon:yes stop_codon:yes gene_type:complete
MVNNSTSDSLRKRLKVKKPYTDNCSFESIGRTAGVNFTLQLVYVWQLINIMSHSIAVSGHNLNNQYNFDYDSSYDPLDLLICLLAQNYYDNDEKYFSLNNMLDSLNAYGFLMDRVTLSLRMKKLVSLRYIDQSTFKSLTEADKKLISQNNRIKIVYRVNQQTIDDIENSYADYNRDLSDTTVVASITTPLNLFVEAMERSLMSLPDSYKLEIADRLSESLKS